MIVSLIAAVAKNGVIGVRGGLPWKLPSDMARFRALTLHHPVIMGRGTYESIGGALTRRTNIVLSRDRSWLACGVFRVGSLDAALERAAHEKSTEAFIIGGAHIYSLARMFAERAYLTLVDAEPEGDTYWPGPSLMLDKAWRVIDSTDHPADEHHAHAYQFVTLEHESRRAP